MSETFSHSLDAFMRNAPSGTNDRVSVRVETIAACLNLRGDAAEIGEEIRTLCDLDLPLQTNTFAVGDGALYWLGPDEWLLLSDGDIDTAKWQAGLAAVGGSVVDISHGYVRLRCEGTDVQDLLAKGCTLDLHESVFPSGCCAQTAIARTNVIIARDADAFELIVRRSFAEYLALWLRRSGEEFGLSFTGRD